MTDDEIVVIARHWLGTPYVHQASVRGVGTDCLGLLRGIWREIYGVEPEPLPAYSSDWDEVNTREVLRDAAWRHLVNVSPDDVGPGHVLLFRMRAGAVAKHVGVMTEGGEAPLFVHAYRGHGVVESHLSDAWRRRLDGVFAFPSL